MELSSSQSQHGVMFETDSMYDKNSSSRLTTKNAFSLLLLLSSP